MVIIHVVCGMIGSGKTTYANQNYKIVSDNDDIKDKDLQLLYTLTYHHDNNDVAHITCYPTETEKSAFENINDIEYIWINTSKYQFKRNIINRNRERDIKNINNVLTKNEILSNKYLASDIMFKVIDIFESNEKW